LSQAQLEKFMTDTSRLRDPLGGPLGRLGQIPRPNGHPRLFHYSCSRTGGDGGGNEISGAGVSRDPLVAQVRAVAETIERYCMSTHSEGQLLRATALELGDTALDLDTIPRAAASEAGIARGLFTRPRKDVSIRWVKALSLIDGRARYVPAIMVYLYLAPATRDENFWAPISTGCASHTDLAQALLSGLCEVVERDALMITWLHQLPLPRIDLTGVTPSEELRAMLEILRVSGLRCELFDATTDLGIPTIYALQLNDENDLLANLVVSATRLDPMQALVRTLEEGCTARIALEARAADSRRRAPAPDEVISLEDCALHYAGQDQRSAFDFLLESGRRRAFADIPNRTEADAAHELRALLEVFRARGMEVLAVDLTTPEMREIGLWTIRVMVPELMPLSYAHALRFLDTPRLYDAPAAMGYGRRGLADITSKLQPFA
jgi:ribosomal protein S12 methylthiotransferase accessory factor